MEKEDGLGVTFTKWTKITVSILDGVILGLIIFHFLYMDFPALSSLSNDKLMLIFSAIISSAGFLAAYKYDGVGGLVILYGFLLFWIVNITHNYSFHFDWITAGSPLSGIMHFFIWRRTSGKTIWGKLD